MNTPHNQSDAERLDRLFRAKSAQAVAALARRFNDLDRAEDAVQDAYVIALARWPHEGPPANPSAWILTVARNCAIDRLRRERAGAAKHELAAAQMAATLELDFEDGAMDDRLAMIFAACHPALSLDTRMALTLRYAAGLTASEIAAGLLNETPAIAQRLVRAKRKIREAHIPITVPDDTALPARIEDVLRVLYLIFNEGYASSTSAIRVRAELCDEAIRLVALLGQLLPAEAEIAGLHALMLFHDARRSTRVDENEDPVLLEDQDRSKWDTRKIMRGLTLLENAQRQGRAGFYQVQAAIAAEHARAETWESTNWFRILRWYDALYALEPSSIVALNRAVAVGYTQGPQAALREIETISASAELEEYPPLHASRAEFLRRLNREAEARPHFARALELSQSEPERRLLRKRLASIQAAASGRN